MEELTGCQINKLVLECGIVPLVPLRGDTIWFYPRGQLSARMARYLEGRNARVLRDFCVTLGRGIGG